MFVIIVAVVITYIAFKGGKFDEETMARLSPPVSPVVVAEGGEVTVAERATRDEPLQAADREAGVAADQPAGGPERDFYVESRLDRERALSRQFELLEAVINNPDSSPEVRSRAQEELLALSRQASVEAETESLIRAKGFDDALVYLHQDGAVVVVRTQLLSRADAAVIMDLVSRVAAVAVEEISVVVRGG